MPYTVSQLSFIAVLAIAAAVLVAPCMAQNSQQELQDYVKLHNAARAEVGVGEVRWNDTVAAWAQSYAEQRRGDCALVHSPDGRPYGENLIAGPPGAALTASIAVQTWVAEKQYYDHSSNSCVQGKMCDHYRQVVWRDTTAIGCARVSCNNGGTFVICSYDPRGNVIGQSPY